MARETEIVRVSETDNDRPTMIKRQTNTWTDRQEGREKKYTLRSNHLLLNSHMHRKLKLAPSPTCPCGREEQTAEHVLQRCPLYEATREDVWPVSTSLTTKLYGCKQELEKTTSFISRAALIL